MTLFQGLTKSAQ